MRFLKILLWGGEECCRGTFKNTPMFQFYVRHYWIRPLDGVRADMCTRHSMYNVTDWLFVMIDIAHERLNLLKIEFGDI